MSSADKNKNNQEIFNRNIPSHLLEPYLSPFPVSTKYNRPDLNMTHRTNDLENNLYHKRINYNQHQMFNPGSSAPWKGYSSNVDKESILRNQTHVLQKCSQSVYVPSSQSDLIQILILLIIRYFFKSRLLDQIMSIHKNQLDKIYFLTTHEDN